MAFPGAGTDRGDAAYVIVGAPLDVSTTFQPGTRFGPDRIRQRARAFEDYDARTDQHFSDLAVHDAGDVRAWTDAEEYLEYLAGTLTDVVEDAVTPVLIGGEHTVSVAGLRATSPDVLVMLDAHLDLRESFDGNPLSHATVAHHARSLVEEVIILGARSGSAAEWERATAPDVTVVPPDDVAGWEPRLADRTAYLSLDIDAADPGEAPGTGTLEPFGLSGRALRDVIRAVAPKAVGFDVVEVNDRDHGQAATLAGKLLREFVFAHAHAQADGETAVDSDTDSTSQ